MTQPTHTPTPWKMEECEKHYRIWGPDTRFLGEILTDDIKQSTRYTEGQANAQFIVKAVNCHEELLEACKNMLAYIDTDDIKPLDLRIARRAIANAERTQQ